MTWLGRLFIATAVPRLRPETTLAVFGLNACLIAHGSTGMDSDELGRAEERAADTKLINSIGARVSL